MISKQLLRKRLGVAAGKDISPKEFSWFFECFCAKYPQYQELKRVRNLETDVVEAFSRYAGYDLRFPIPLPFP